LLLLLLQEEKLLHIKKSKNRVTKIAMALLDLDSGVTNQSLKKRMLRCPVGRYSGHTKRSS